MTIRAAAIAATWPMPTTLPANTAEFKRLSLSPLCGFVEGHGQLPAANAAAFTLPPLSRLRFGTHVLVPSRVAQRAGRKRKTLERIHDPRELSPPLSASRRLQGCARSSARGSS